MQAPFKNSDLAIASAAVGDFRPKWVAGQKMKKEEEAPVIRLEQNPDILAGWGRQREHQIVVGFALETNAEETNAQSKLKRKNADVIVLNSLRNEGAGFGHDTNQVTILDRHNKRLDIGLKSKLEVAEDIMDFLEKEWIS